MAIGDSDGDGDGDATATATRRRRRATWKLEPSHLEIKTYNLEQSSFTILERLFKGFLGRETLFMMINDDQKFTTISMFTMISMSKIHNHRYKNSFCEIEPQINQII